MRRRFLIRGRSILVAAILGLVVSACGDDDPSGPSENFDIVGEWQWRVNNATASGATCNVTNVTLSFTRTNGTLTGSQFSPGGGNVECTTSSGTSTSSYTTNASMKNLVHTGTSISFAFATSAGDWEMTGSITGTTAWAAPRRSG